MHHEFRLEFLFDIYFIVHYATIHSSCKSSDAFWELDGGEF